MWEYNHHLLIQLPLWRWQRFGLHVPIVWRSVATFWSNSYYEGGFAWSPCSYCMWKGSQPLIQLRVATFGLQRPGVNGSVATLWSNMCYQGGYVQSPCLVSTLLDLLLRWMMLVHAIQHWRTKAAKTSHSQNYHLWASGLTAGPRKANVLTYVLWWYLVADACGRYRHQLRRK